MSESRYHHKWSRESRSLCQSLARSVHASWFPELHHSYQTQEYSHCAQQVTSLLKQTEDPVPDYYKASYMLLLAICQPYDKHARIWNFQAMSTFRKVVMYDSRTAKSQALLETLLFISMLVNVHLGASGKKREAPTQEMEEDIKEWLRKRSLIELGLETFKVHSALMTDLQRWDADESEKYRREMAKDLRQVHERLDESKDKQKARRETEVELKERERQAKRKQQEEERIAHEVEACGGNQRQSAEKKKGKERVTQKIEAERKNYGPESTKLPTGQASSSCPHDERQETAQGLGNLPKPPVHVSTAGPHITSDAGAGAASNTPSPKEYRHNKSARAPLRKPHPLRFVQNSEFDVGQNEGKVVKTEFSVKKPASDKLEILDQTALDHTSRSRGGMIHNARNSKRPLPNTQDLETMAKRQIRRFAKQNPRNKIRENQQHAFQTSSRAATWYHERDGVENGNHGFERE
ncbi:hypothetical protein BKA65DRAFT_535614 [Rhexocercosporidium sp. MPI-PUGE-AT-0058]|nr:hypothetical protein BKA65DRAFT_535614 [Rhexocercosporidium sp. MPI-PUGE-AT-0058]